MKLFRKPHYRAQNKLINKKEQPFISKNAENKEESNVQPFFQKNALSKQSGEDTEQEK